MGPETALVHLPLKGKGARAHPRDAFSKTEACLHSEHFLAGSQTTHRILGHTSVDGFRSQGMNRAPWATSWPILALNRWNSIHSDQENNRLVCVPVSSARQDHPETHDVKALKKPTQSLIPPLATMLLGGHTPAAVSPFSPSTSPECSWPSSPRSLTHPTVLPWLTERPPCSGRPAATSARLMNVRTPRRPSFCLFLYKVVQK